MAEKPAQLKNVALVGMTRTVYDRRIMTTARILFFLLAAVVSWAQTSESVSLADTQQRTLTSGKIGQRYELLVSLPADYAKSGQSYPVLYVLDGWHFPLMTFIQENNVFSKRMRPVIIVNVSHGVTDYMALRARDFTPTRTSREVNSGGAPAFLDFLEHELIPFVDRTWRTMPADRGLLGHPYGGLFAIYVLEQRPALFQRIVAASPALEWDSRLLLTSARDRLRTLQAPVRLDLSVGDESDNTASTTAFAKILDELKPTGLDYRFTVYRGENHDSVRLVSFPAGLYWAYRPAK
jgi:predicted alpha/beta superfamily hydrolase